MATFYNLIDLLFCLKVINTYAARSFFIFDEVFIELTFDCILSKKLFYLLLSFSFYLFFGFWLNWRRRSLLSHRWLWGLSNRRLWSLSNRGLWRLLNRRMRNVPLIVWYLVNHKKCLSRLRIMISRKDWWAIYSEWYLIMRHINF